MKTQAKRRSLSALHQADDPEAVERRRDEAVALMREARAELVRLMSDLPPSEAFQGEEWAPMHVLWHLAGGHTHMEPARLIVERGVTELADRDRRAELAEAYARVLRNIDDWIRWSSEFTREQLTLYAKRVNRDYYVIGMVESTAEHVHDHVAQVKQIRERIAQVVPRP